ncbi:MAG: hypothetical protein ACLGI2_00670 [Acidimicrobiia bacterium]|jgi:hypothetical protein
MGWWVREPDLLGEDVRWRRNANREQTTLRQVGGTLFVTPRRILFVPNRFDDATGGAEWSCALSEVRDVTVEPAGLATPLPGRTAKLRRRLRVELASGDVELFVVNRVEDAVAALREAIARAKEQAR